MSIIKASNIHPQEGWTALHCAASAGFLDVAKLLVESGASAEVIVGTNTNITTTTTTTTPTIIPTTTTKSNQDETKNGRVALWYAASEGHNAVLYFLLREKHKSYSLLEDRRVSCHK